MVQAEKLASSKVGKIAKFVGNLEAAHTSTVNCLKFSPTGQYFASGGDGFFIQNIVNYIAIMNYR